MILKKSIFNLKDNTDNRGFSIVELMVAVAILAIVFTPILNSFTTASVTNSKAQVIQNATSTAEIVMEKVKSSSIEQLYTEAVTDNPTNPAKVGSTTLTKDQITFISNYPTNSTEDSSGFVSNKVPPYKIVYNGITATKGRTFDAEVYIDPEPYAVTPAPSTTPAPSSDVSNINEVFLPKLYDIKDSKDHAVISWELSKHDEGAADNLANEIADDSSASMKVSDVLDGIADHGYKITEINISGGGNDTRITCDVMYQLAVGGTIKQLSYNVYNGNLKKLDVNKNSNGGPHVYLFYRMMPSFCTKVFPNEVISVNDSTTDGSVHNVYIMLQDDNKIKNLRYDGGKSNLEVKANGTSLAKSTGLAYHLTASSWPISATETMYTNFKQHDGTMGNLYESKKKKRVYQVTVVIKDMADEKARLTSTINAGKEADN